MARYAFARHELGLLIPATAGARPELPGVPNADRYVTASELTGAPAVREQDLAARLGGLSAADCLVAIAHLSTRLFAQRTPQEGPGLQYELAEQMLGAAPSGAEALEKLRSGEITTVFFEQQLVHLARLVIMHADRRPRDHFANGGLLKAWASCLIDVGDLLDPSLDISDEQQRLSWELRQCALNHYEDQMPSSALHHEVYRLLWPERTSARYQQVNDAFERHTEMRISDYFTIGAAVLARLVVRGSNEPTVLPAIEPAEYFSSASIDAANWQAFFKLSARDPDTLRRELLAEQETYGPTTYGSLTFERYPLAEIEPGVYVPVSMKSLQRRVSEGVFHLLREAATAEGRDLRRYSSRFGRVFQESVEQTLRRGVAFAGEEIPIVADVNYGTPAQPRDSTDVILAYERNPVFVEVVSGPLLAATITRGDLASFRKDADRLVVEKARQLDESIAAFKAGNLVLPGVDPDVVSRVWPVIVTSHPFPHRELIIRALKQRVRDAGHLQGDCIPGLAIVSAEELFFCEGFMQQGLTFLALVRGWKSGPHPDLSFKNYLIELGNGRAPISEHCERRFAEFNVENMNRVLGLEEDITSALENMHAGRPASA
jgi:hypothetical protein